MRSRRVAALLVLVLPALQAQTTPFKVLIAHLTAISGSRIEVVDDDG